MRRFLRRHAPYWHIYTGLICTALLAGAWFVRADTTLRRVESMPAAVEEIRFNLKAVAKRIGVDYIETANRGD